MAEMTKHGLTAMPTTRSSKGPDIMMFNEKTGKAFGIQVKASTTSTAYWLIGNTVKDIVSDSYVYVFVTIKTTKSEAEEVSYFVLPSKVVSKMATIKRTGKGWPYFDAKYAEPYKDDWDIFKRK